MGGRLDREQFVPGVTSLSQQVVSRDGTPSPRSVKFPISEGFAGPGLAD